MGKWEWEIESTPSPGDDSIISQATHPPTTTQLLTMKECSHKKVSLVKMSLDDLLDPSGKKNNQVAIDNNNRGGVQHDQGKGYQQAKTYQQLITYRRVSLNDQEK